MGWAMTHVWRKACRCLTTTKKTQAAHPLVAVQSLPDTDIEPIIRWIILRKWSKLAPLTDGGCAKEIPKAYLAGGRVCLTMAEPIRAVDAGFEMLGISWNDIISDHFPNVNLTYPFLVPKKCNRIKFLLKTLTIRTWDAGEREFGVGPNSWFVQTWGIPMDTSFYASPNGTHERPWW